MAKNKQENEELIGLGEKLSNERLSTGKKKVFRRLALLGGVLLLGIIIYWSFVNNAAAGKYEFVRAMRRDIRESVEITGNVEAGATINLTFRDSGQIDKINFDVGERIKKGDIIASLKNRDQELRLRQARANLAGAEANLSERLAGYTGEEIRIAEAGVLKAEAAAQKISIDWENAKTELDLMRKKYEQDEKRVQLAVDDALSKYEFAQKNKENTGKSTGQAVDTAMKDLEAQLYLTGSQIQQSLLNLKSVIIDDGNSVLGYDVRRLDYRYVDRARELYVEVLNAFNPMFDQFKSSSGYQAEQLKAYAVQEQGFATKLLEAQKLTADALAVLPASSTLPESKLSELKAKILADSNALSGSFAGLNLKYQTILDAQLGVATSGDTRDSEITSARNYYEQQLQTFEQTKIDHQVDLNARQASISSLAAQYKIQLAEIESAKAALEQRKVGPRAVDVAYLRTQITANQIAVALAEEALEKTLLRAPMDGVLSRRNIDEGEDVVSSNSVAATGVPVFEMIAAQKFKIDAAIAEVDINKLNIGDKAEITLDAVGSDIFEGTIVKIDPVETVIQDVVFYKAEVVIDSTDSRIKPGMTATVDIVLQEVKAAVSLPEKAVQTENGKKYVRQLEGKSLKNIPVETGLRDLQGNIEIKNGISEGQEIILRTLNGRG